MEHSNEATAYHEAGHAVVALALGRPVDRATIVPDPKHAGLCEFRKGSFRPSDDWLEREILIALGGVAAEARHTGNYAWDSAARDDRLARSLAVQRAGERRAERLQRRLLAKVEHLLAQEENWRTVEAIVGELLRLGTITGRAARHFFNSFTRGGKMQKLSQRLDSFITQITHGAPSPIPEGEDMGGDRVGSGTIAEVDERTYRFYMNDNAGPPKVKYDDWFIFSDARLVTQPGILFWQRDGKYFARRLDDAAWEKFLKIAKVNRASW